MRPWCSAGWSGRSLFSVCAGQPLKEFTQKARHYRLAWYIMLPMKVAKHPKIIDWPQDPGGPNPTAPRPQARSQAIFKKVHIDSVTDKAVPLTCEFRGNLFTYDVLTGEHDFAKRLAAEFSKHVGETLEQLGDLDIDF